MEKADSNWIQNTKDSISYAIYNVETNEHMDCTIHLSVKVYITSLFNDLIIVTFSADSGRVQLIKTEILYSQMHHDLITKGRYSYHLRLLLQSCKQNQT